MENIKIHSGLDSIIDERIINKKEDKCVFVNLMRGLAWNIQNQQMTTPKTTIGNPVTALHNRLNGKEKTIPMI